jgi:hypothetical protein
MKKEFILALTMACTPVMAEQASVICTMGTQFFDCPTSVEGSNLIADVENAETIYQHRVETDAAFKYEMRLIENVKSTKGMVKMLVNTTDSTVADIIAAIIRKDGGSVADALKLVEPFFNIVE